MCMCVKIQLYIIYKYTPRILTLYFRHIFVILIHFAAKNNECQTFQELRFLFVFLLFRRKYTDPAALSHGDAIYLTEQS